MNEKRVSCTCESETDEQKYKKIASVIEEYKDREGSLIQVLHIAQGIYGFLPVELQKFIADGMGIPFSEVTGVSSFYSFFTTTPKGKYSIKVCLGTACYVRGGKKITEKVRELLGIDVGETTEDGKYSLEVMRCIGACGLAPAMIINEKVYKQVNPENIQTILNELE